MRKQLIVLGMVLHFAVSAPAQVSFGFGLQTDNVNISLSTYPNLVRVPGYPVYYASGLNSNYFFYDGMYWVFESDRWYSSSWYNGPWMLVDPEYIPVYLLRVPVRYYRSPPAFFVGWQANSPPRWNDHWGNDWAQHRSGWDRWNRRAMPAPAPLPTYQRKYSGDRYPSRDQQPILQQRNYRHAARDPLVRQQSNVAPPTRSQPESTQPRRGQPEPAQPRREEAPQRRNAEPSAARPRPEPAVQHQMPAAPRGQEPQRARNRPEQQRQPQAAPRVEERPAPRAAPQPQREPPRQPNMRPQAEPNQQRGQPANEARPAPRSAEQGQHPGQQRERDNSDERGQGRGR